MKKMLMFLIIVLCFAGMVNAANCGLGVACACGDTLTDSRTLVAGEDTLTDCTGNGLIIGGAGLTLNGNGFNITGDKSSGHNGILNSGHANVQIVGVKINGFENGIKLSSAIGNLISNSVINGSTNDGIYIDSGRANTIQETNISNSQNNGIEIQTTAFSTTISDCQIMMNNIGINTFQNITATDNFIAGNNNWDVYFGTIENAKVCDTTVMNSNTGTGMKPILFHNTITSISDETNIGSLILCHATGSVIDNVTIGTPMPNNGIQVLFSNSTIIANSILSNNYRGIEYYKSANGKVMNNKIESNTQEGILMDYSTEKINITYNNISSNNIGINFKSTTGHLVHSNIIKDSTTYGLDFNCLAMMSSCNINTKFFNNIFNNTNNFHESGSMGGVTLAQWNTSRQSGNNLMGGEYLGGNYWSTNTNCQDSDYDGFCDKQYNITKITSWNHDDLPLAEFTIMGPAKIENKRINETDQMYSFCSKNNIVTVIVNASNTTRVIANFSMISQEINCAGLASGPVVQLTKVNGLWIGKCNVSSVAKRSNFVGGPIILVAQNNLPSFDFNTDINIVLYNMTTPPMQGGCDRFGSKTTNMCQVTNFNNVNFVIEIQTNGTCKSQELGQPLPWTDYKSMVLFNFTSIDMSVSDIGDKLRAIGGALSVYITPPGQFGDSYIGVDTSAFAELDTSTRISVYGLPFAEQPEISEEQLIQELGMTAESITDIAFTKNAPYQIEVTCEDICMDYVQLGFPNIPTCITTCHTEGDWEYTQTIPNNDLSFTVSGFTTYNMSDKVDPTIKINKPLLEKINQSQNYILINYTMNGTGTQLSQIQILNNGNLVETRENSDLFSTCKNNTKDWNVVTCTTNVTSLTQGLNHITIVATDLGGSNGNSAQMAIEVLKDSLPPKIIASDQIVQYDTNFVYDLTATDAMLRVDKYRITNANFTINSATGLLKNATKLKLGTQLVTIYVNDTVGNLNMTTITVTVIDTVNPKFGKVTNQLINPNTRTLKYWINATDNVGITQYTVDNNNFIINASGFLLNNTKLPSGVYNLIITVADFSENENSTSLTITADGSAPSVSATNQVIEYGTAFSYQITATDALTTVDKYRITNTNFTINSATGLLKNATKLKLGTQLVTIYVNDTVGNINTTTITVSIIDTQSPKFGTVSTQIIGANRRLTYWINATDNVGITQYKVNNVNFTINATGFLKNATKLSSGSYTLTITVNDTTGNSNMTTLSVLIDSVGPTIVATNQTNEYGTAFMYDIDATDALSSVDKYRITNANFIINKTTGLLKNNTKLNLGTEVVTIYVNDTYGNVNSATITITTRDTQKPKFASLTNQIVNYSKSFLYPITATDNVAIAEYKVNDTNFVIDRDDNLRNNTKLAVKTYNLLITANDTSGNANTTTLSVTVVLVVKQNITANTSTKVDLGNAGANLTIFLIGNTTATIVAEKITPTATGTTATLTPVRGINLTVDPTVSGNLSWAVIRIYYEDSDVTGLDEANMNMYYYNETSGDWQLLQRLSIDTVNNYIEVNVTHFSLYAIFGSTSTSGGSSGGGSGGSSGRVITTSTPTPICNPVWECNGWSECSNEGIQTRTCRDINNCETTNKMPNTAQSCTYQVKVEEKTITPTEEITDKQLTPTEEQPALLDTVKDKIGFATTETTTSKKIAITVYITLAGLLTYLAISKIILGSEKTVKKSSKK